MARLTVTRVAVLLLALAVAAAPTVAGVALTDDDVLDVIPNGRRVRVNGHFWRSPLRVSPRGSASAALNAFGTLLAANGNAWTAGVCGADSDGDGFTNGEELGDPGCVWVPGAAPNRTADVSAPGEWSAVPTAATFPGRTQTYAPETCTRPAQALPDRDAEGDALRGAVPVPAGWSGVEREAELARVRELDDDAPLLANSTHASGRCPHELEDLEMWHAAATWPGEAVPAAGSDVTVPAGKRVLVTACSLPDAGFGRVTVPAGAELIFDDASVHLRAKAVVVHGQLHVGSRHCPVRGAVTITLAAQKAEMATYDNGLSVFGSGVVQMFGWTQQRTWTRLKATAHVGATAIATLHPTTWAAGDELVLVTSIWRDTLEDQNEVRRVVARDAANASVLLLDRPLAFRHYAGHEYQSEVALLSRTILIRGGQDAAAHADCYGGHTWAVGPNATYRMVGVRAERMGQRNVMARYPFHFHMMYEGGYRGYVQQCAVTNSYFRGVTIHGTNATLVRKNVAFNTTGHTYYMEDGAEMWSVIEHNLAAKVAVMGEPASGGAQAGQRFVQTEEVSLPADHTASGFYLSNAHNWVRGNAASGGWAGFAFPLFDNPLKLSSHIRLAVPPRRQQILEFDGNTCHSSGHHWVDAGCVYAAGKLEVNADTGLLRYHSGRFAGTRNTRDHSGAVAWDRVTNLRVWLSQKGFATWGKRVDLVQMEAHDCTRAALIFGQSSLQDSLIVGVSGNGPHDMAGVARQGVQFYDTWTMTLVSNVTARNYFPLASETQWSRSGIFVDMTHSDIFKPWGINAVRAVTTQNVDRSAILAREVQETGASRMFNIMDWDGSLANTAQCAGHIVGSESDWWNAFDDCWFDAEWPAWICPRAPGREVVGLDMDLGEGVQRRMDERARTNKQLTPEQRERLYIGNMSYFGSRADRRLTITRNNHLATGVSGTAWYLHFSQTGVPESFTMNTINFPRGAYVFLAISLPSDASIVSVSTRWNWWYRSADGRRIQFKAAPSREAVLHGNGTWYHWDGRHLYLKVSDLYSAYPNPATYTREGVELYGTNSNSGASQWFIELACPTTYNTTDNHTLCARSGAFDPPADIDVPVVPCNTTADLDPPPLCPNGTESDPGCERFAPYPYTCSPRHACPPRGRPPQVVDWCAPLWDTTAPAGARPESDACRVALCNSTAQAVTRLAVPQFTPCDINNDDGGVLLAALCTGGACRGESQAGANVSVQRTGADPASALEAAVTVRAGRVLGVTAHYRYAHEAVGLRGSTPPSAGRQAAMELVSSSWAWDAEAAPGLRNVTTARFRVAVAARVGGNVTLVVDTSEWGAVTRTVTDWGQRASLTPVPAPLGPPAAGSVDVHVPPIDFVSNASLAVVDVRAARVVQADVAVLDGRRAGDVARLSLTTAGGALPALAAGQALAVRAELTSGVVVQTTLPCLGAVDGAACEGGVVDTRPPLDTCALSVLKGRFWGGYSSFTMPERWDDVASFVVVQASGNRTLPLLHSEFKGGVAADVRVERPTVIVTLHDGTVETFGLLDSHPTTPVRGTALACLNGSDHTKGERWAQHVMRRGAAGACEAQRCVVGLTPYTTTTTTAAATTTTTASSGTTTEATTTMTTTTDATTTTSADSSTTTATTDSTTTTSTTEAGGSTTSTEASTTAVDGTTNTTSTTISSATTTTATVTESTTTVTDTTTTTTTMEPATETDEPRPRTARMLALAVRIRGNFRAMWDNTTNWRRLRWAVRLDIARALRIAVRRVIIESMRLGSLEVNCTIYGDDSTSSDAQQTTTVPTDDEGTVMLRSAEEMQTLFDNAAASALWLVNTSALYGQESSEPETALEVASSSSTVVVVVATTPAPGSTNAGGPGPQSPGGNNQGGNGGTQSADATSGGCGGGCMVFYGAIFLTIVVFVIGTAVIIVVMRRRSMQSKSVASSKTVPTEPYSYQEEEP